MSVPVNEKGECATPKMVRCMNCSYLTECDGSWRCSDGDKNIETIPDEECSLNQEY